MIVLTYQRPEYAKGQRTGNFIEHRSEVTANISPERAKKIIKMAVPDAGNIQVVSDGSKS